MHFRFLRELYLTFQHMSNTHAVTNCNSFKLTLKIKNKMLTCFYHLCVQVSFPSVQVGVEADLHQHSVLSVGWVGEGDLGCWAWADYANPE